MVYAYSNSGIACLLVSNVLFLLALLQAHMQARFVILRVLLEAGEGFVQVQKLTNKDDGQSDILLSMERSKINTTGKKAIGEFLRKLQVLVAVAL